jgi:DNA-directed RNA polymerase beta subunit
MNKELIDSKSKKVLKSYFEDNALVQSDIESYNDFVNNRLHDIATRHDDIEPTILPDEVDDFHVEFDDIKVHEPRITEADGSTRRLLPNEARLRELNYTAPIELEVTSYVDGEERDNFTTQVGQMPVMLKSDYCHLTDMSREELMDAGEDPDDEGGYFIINGTEKVLVGVEDLAANRFGVDTKRTGAVDYVGKIYSEEGSYKIPHRIEKKKDELFYTSFTRVKSAPLIVVVKALGLLNDEQIMEHVGLPDASEVFVNLMAFSDLNEREEALDHIAQKMGITQAKEVRVERVEEILDEYLLPHIGQEPEHRHIKAVNLLKFLKHYIHVLHGDLEETDKDHYGNKRVKLAGDLLADLFQVNMKVLTGDLTYNFQRMVKRGKFPDVKTIIREKLLTQRVTSAMATGNWVGGRTGICQRIERINYLSMLSSLQRVVSPLSSSQENFGARSLHTTHMGRLCMTETPEGQNIGLRKNLAMLARVTGSVDENKLLDNLTDLGLDAEAESL